MKKRTWIWIVVAAGVVCLAVVSCCCFTGMLGSMGGRSSSRDPAVVTSEPAPEPIASPEPAPAPVAAPAALPNTTPVPGPCDDLEPIEMPELAREARIDLEVLVGDDHRPRLRLRHNLPAGTILMTDVEGHNFHGQSRVTAEAPCVIAGPFGPQNGGLPIGSYTASVMTPDAAVQPPAVREAFGLRGAALRGRQVRRDHGERRLDVERRFHIGAADAASANDTSRAATTRDLQRRLHQAIQAGRAMRGLRRDQSLDGLRRCGDRMRALQADLRQIRAEAEANGDRQIAAATGSAMMCVSCSRNADQWCQDD